MDISHKTPKPRAKDYFSEAFSSTRDTLRDPSHVWPPIRRSDLSKFFPVHIYYHHRLLPSLLLWVRISPSHRFDLQSAFPVWH